MNFKQAQKVVFEHNRTTAKQTQACGPPGCVAAAPSQSRSGDHRFNSYDLSHSSFFSNCVSQSVSHSAARSPGTKKKLAACVFALFLFTEKKNIRTPIWKWRAQRDWSVQEVKPIEQQ